MELFNIYIYSHTVFHIDSHLGSVCSFEAPKYFKRPTATGHITFLSTTAITSLLPSSSSTSMPRQHKGPICSFATARQLPYLCTITAMPRQFDCLYSTTSTLATTPALHSLSFATSNNQLCLIAYAQQLPCLLLFLCCHVNTDH